MAEVKKQAPQAQAKPTKAYSVSNPDDDYIHDDRTHLIIDEGGMDDSPENKYGNVDNFVQHLYEADPVYQKQQAIDAAEERQRRAATSHTAGDSEIAELYRSRNRDLAAQKAAADAANPALDAKANKRKSIIAAVGDSLSAISDMVAAAKGAPITTPQQPTLSNAVAQQQQAATSRYKKMLNAWRTAQNDAIKSYEQYQYKRENAKARAEANRIAAERELRLNAKDAANDAYRTKYLEMKQQGLDDAAAKAEAEREYKQAYLGIMNRRLDIQAKAEANKYMPKKEVTRKGKMGRDNKVYMYDETKTTTYGE